MPGTHRGSGTGPSGGGAHARSHLPWAVVLGVVLVLLLAGGVAALMGLRPGVNPSTPAAPTPAGLPSAAPPSAPLQARLDEITAAAPLLFEGDRTDVPPADVATLTLLAGAMRADPAPVVVLTGHTAPVDGDPARCLRISQDRADAVARWLVGAGVAPDRLRTVGMSHSESEHGQTWPQARRVELRTA